MAVKMFQALSLLVILSLATNCNLVSSEGAGMPRPDQKPGLYKIFNSQGYLTATADGKIIPTPKDGSQSPAGTSWLVQCDKDGANCDIAALDPPPTWEFYGRLDAWTGPVIETFPPLGFVRLNTNLTDTSPSNWKIRVALPGGGWHITSNSRGGDVGYLIFRGNGVRCRYLEPVASGEAPRPDQIPGEDTLWSFEEIPLESA